MIEGTVSEEVLQEIGKLWDQIMVLKGQEGALRSRLESLIIAHPELSLGRVAKRLNVSNGYVWHLRNSYYKKGN